MSEAPAINISIIVPCYNAAATIGRALDSVVTQQGAPSIEVVVVDDGSLDCSAALVEGYLNNHPTLNGRLVRLQINTGVSAARNAGLDGAQGEFVLFLDADDTLAPDCCRRLWGRQQVGGADIVACNALRLFSNDRQRAYAAGHGSCQLTGKDFQLRQDCHGLFDTACAKLFRRNLLDANHIRFQPGLSFGEDTLFANVAALKAENIFVEYDYCGYLYQDNQGSCSNTIDVWQRLASLEKVLHGVAECLGETCSPLLLRKACEYIWCIRKFWGGDRREILSELVGSSLWQRLLFPVIATYGKWKHRSCIRLWDRGKAWSIRFW